MLEEKEPIVNDPVEDATPEVNTPEDSNQEKPEGVWETQGHKLLYDVVICDAMLSVGILVMAGMSMVILRDWMIFFCVAALSAFMGAISFLHYLTYRKGNFHQITAVCIAKSRTGYRKQYYSYDFQVTNSEVDAFEILTASKRKFHVGYTYKMVFKGKSPPYSTQSLLGFEHINSEEFRKKDQES